MVSVCGFGLWHFRRAGQSALALIAASIWTMTGTFGVSLGNEMRMRVFNVSIRAAIFRNVVRIVSKVAVRQRDFLGAA